MNADDLVSPSQATDFLIVECRERGDILTNLKLQKLLYYAQAWFLVLHKRHLFQEDFQAWIHGPVLPSQYHRFKHLEWRPIQDDLPRPNIPEKIVDHLNEVIDVFGVETAIALERMTHNEMPWKLARKEIPSDKPSDAIITKESMLSFYQSL